MNTTRCETWSFGLLVIQLAGMNPMVDTLIAEMRQCVEQLADPHRGRNTQYRFSDVSMATFSEFFTQLPSFLSRQRQMARGNDSDSSATSLFGIAQIPCDNQILQSLDGISPESFYGALDAALAALWQKPGGMKLFRHMGDRWNCWLSANKLDSRRLRIYILIVRGELCWMNFNTLLSKQDAHLQTFACFFDKDKKVQIEHRFCKWCSSCSVNQCAKTTQTGKSATKPENFQLQYELQSNTKTRN